MTDKTLAMPVPFAVTLLQTLAAFETMLGELDTIHQAAGGVANEAVNGVTMLTSGLHTALLDAGINPDTGLPE